MSGINGTGGVKVGELLRECMKALEAAGNDNPRFEAEQLVMKFCGVKRSDILMFPGLEVTAEQAAEVCGAVQRRNSGVRYLRPSALLCVSARLRFGR